MGLKRTLGDSRPYLNLPKKGVYIFFSSNELRTSSNQMRVTRIGTHAISKNNKTSLWNRLSTHRGTIKGLYPGGGYHRISVFRKIVGESIIIRDNLHGDYPNWSNKISKNIKGEYILEKLVSNFIRKLPFLWINITNEKNGYKHRKYIEENSIALLSNFNKIPIDPRSSEWLGKYSKNEKIKFSGLWNSDHVDKKYDSSFFKILEKYIDNM